MEPLEPGHGGRAQNPRLASLQKDGLHDRLIELGAYLWGCILPLQHLPNPCPRPARLAVLAPHSLDVIIVVLVATTDHMIPELCPNTSQAASVRLWFSVLKLYVRFRMAVGNQLANRVLPEGFLYFKYCRTKSECSLS